MNHNKDRPISLPNQSSPIKHFALDIGGTLAKLVYFVQNRHENNGDKNELGGKLHFIKFQTKNIDDCFNFIIENKLHLEDGKPKVVRVTGGGAYKYADLFEQKLGCTLIKEDEMFCLILGTNFLLNNIHRESFTYSPLPNAASPKEFVDKVENPYPYLLVQIGSGVSVIRVDSETSFQRVDGTSLGGGTFWGLCSLLTGVTDFDEMLELTKHGHSNTVDLVVGDIYGTDYSKVEKKPVKKEDIAQSLLKMVSNNIGQIAYLNSQRYGLNKIYFGGFFIRDHPNTMQRISFAIDFWSKGKTKAMFLVHDGYLGALGAFLAPEPTDPTNLDNITTQDTWLKKTTREFQRLFSKPSLPTTTISSTSSTPSSSPTSSTSSYPPTPHNSAASYPQSSKFDDDIICDCGCEYCEGLYEVAKKVPDAHDSGIWSVSWSGDVIATGGMSSKVKLWNAAPGAYLTEKKAFDKHVLGATSLSIDMSSQKLATSGMDSHIRLYDLNEMRLHKDIDVGPFGTWSVAFSPNGDGASSTSKVSILCVAFSPNGSHFACGGSDGSVSVYEVETGKKLNTFNAHSLPIRSITYAPDSASIFTASDDTQIRQHDHLSSKGLITSFQGHTAWVLSHQYAVITFVSPFIIMGEQM
eukprot:gene12028-14069_t